METKILPAPAFWANTKPGVSAASVMKSVKASLNGSLHQHFNPVIEWSQCLLPFSGNMLELHFERNQAWFDFAYRINKYYDAPLLNRALLPEAILPFLQDQPGRLFQKPMARFRYGIENVCIEYDFPFQSPPALFFDLHRDTVFTPGRNFEDLKELASAFQQPVYEKLSGFFANIKTAGLHVVYAGFMRSRKATSVRFTIEGLQFNKLVETIIALGWKGNRNALSKLQQTYLEPGHRLVLCVDFDKGLGNKLGIEVHAPDWEPILKKLAANGICNEKQHQLLKSWSGQTALHHPLSKALTMLHQRNITCLYRRLNHFKFTLDADTINTKAYLYYCF